MTRGSSTFASEINTNDSGYEIAKVRFVILGGYQSLATSHFNLSVSARLAIS
jgi:hypothetical protein